MEVLLISSNSNHLSVYPETNKTYNQESIEKLKHIWIDTYKYGKSSSYKRLLSWLDFDKKLLFGYKKFGNKPDIIIISSLSLTSILFGIHMKKKYKCKLIFEIRDIYPLTLVEELGFSAFNPLVRLLSIIEKKGYKKADLIVGTMPNLTEHVNKLLRTKKEVFYSPLGIPEIWKNPIMTNSLITDLFPRDKFIIGYAGSIGKSNSLDSFFEAVKTIEFLDPTIHFVIVGDGTLKEKYIQELQTFNNVTFGEKIPQNKVPSFLKQCDVLYLSTHKSKVWDYGQSMNKMVDYMMSGKPILASYGGFQSMLNEAESGFFIPPDDAKLIISKILEFKSMGHEQLLRYGSNGKKWILENQTYEVISKRYYEKIEEL